MKKLIVLFSVLISTMCIACSGQNNNAEDDNAKIQKVIENHDVTMIFIWAEYCQASKNMYEKNIKPYLDGLAKNNAGIVIIYYGKEEAVADLKEDNILVINKKQHSPLLIKRNANKMMKRILKDYKRHNGMPIPLLVDRDGFVKNYDKKRKSYDYWEIFQAAK